MIKFIEIQENTMWSSVNIISFVMIEFVCNKEYITSMLYLRRNNIDIIFIPNWSRAFHFYSFSPQKWKKSYYSDMYCMNRVWFRAQTEILYYPQCSYRFYNTPKLLFNGYRGSSCQS